MGLLDAFKQYISDIGGSLNPEIGGLLAQTGETIKRNARQRDTVMKGLLADPSNRDLQRQAVAQGLDMASIAPIGMTVWHGSPHKFTKFDMSKIGTGEGAQAYGHGLYMAEHPEVAREYQKKLSKSVTVDGKKLQSVPSDGLDAQAYHSVITRIQNGLDPKQAIDEAAKYWDDAANEMLGFMKTNPELAQRIQKEASGRAAIANKVRKLSADSFYLDPGALYKVDIPDEAVARMLDWDKPLSQQAHVMQLINKQEAARTQSVLDKRLQTLANVGDDAPNAAVIKKQIAILQDELVNPQGSGLGSMTGGEYYNYLRRRDMPPQEQAEMFSGAGIPGIRYLDGGSRSAGQGSSNFVLFDDQLPRIMEINGQATGAAPWKPGEWRGLLSP